jgi:serine/threonine-protein kinase PRP4
MLGLKLMRKCQIVHADIKLDNILISEDKQKLKICDLGCAHDVQETEATSYVCSRWYRAVEICLGHKYDTQSDMWSTATCIYEMFTGQVLFTGDSNNDMLRLFQESLGKILRKMVNLGERGARHHFNAQGEFVWRTYDKSTRKSVTKVLTDFPTVKLEDRIYNYLASDASSQQKRKARQLGEFLVKCMLWDPTKRATPEVALEHVFLTEKWTDEPGDKKPGEKAAEKPGEKKPSAGEKRPGSTPVTEKKHAPVKK